MAGNLIHDKATNIHEQLNTVGNRNIKKDICKKANRQHSVIRSVNQRELAVFVVAGVSAFVDSVDEF